MNTVNLQFGFRRSLPVVLQNENAECGLACVAMIAGYHGHVVDLRTLRQRLSISLRGTTLAQLLELSASLKLEGRPVRLEPEDLAELRTPGILHWDMAHFVVLKSVKRGRLIIHDPAFGIRRLTLAEVANHFTGVALELNPALGFEFKKEATRVKLSDLTGRVVGLKRAAAHLFVFAIVLELLAIISPFFVQWVTDQVLVRRDTALLPALGVGFGLLIVVQAFVGAVRSWAALYFGTSLNIQWFSNLFTHLLRLPIPFFEKRSLGDLISRLDAGRQIQQALTSSLIEALVDGVMGFLMLAVMFLYSGVLGFVGAASMALYALLRFSIYRSARRANEDSVVLSAKQHGFLIETLRGIQTLKMFGRETQRMATSLNLQVEATNAKLAADKLEIITRAANTLIFGLASVFIVWLGAGAVLESKLSLGMLLAFLAYKDQFNSRVISLIDRSFELRMLSVQADRLSDVVLEPVEAVSQRGVSGLLKAGAHKVELRSVCFRYADSDPWILRDLDLEVQPGECLAIVGRSGAGKSTLIKLLAGLLQPNEGEVRVGGLSTFRNRAAINSVVGFVLQEDHLFSGTIGENIHFFDDEPDLERVRQAAIQARIHCDIAAMPMGYESLVGDMGAALSGGQKQRILLARALYRKPSILVLDEATSHLDIETEQLIALTLQSLSLTRIIVAHRPQTIAIADRVLTIHDGQLQAAKEKRKELKSFAEMASESTEDVAWIA